MREEKSHEIHCDNNSIFLFGVKWKIPQLFFVVDVICPNESDYRFFTHNEYVGSRTD